MEVVLLLSAERDLQEAYNWVEEHRRGREQFFLQDVELRTSGAAAILDENPLADVIELKVISGSHEIRGAKPERSQKRPHQPAQIFGDRSIAL